MGHPDGTYNTYTHTFIQLPSELGVILYAFGQVVFQLEVFLVDLVGLFGDLGNAVFEISDAFLMILAGRPNALLLVLVTTGVLHRSPISINTWRVLLRVFVDATSYDDMMM